MIWLKAACALAWFVILMLAIFGSEIRVSCNHRRRRRSWRLSKTVPKKGILL